MAVHEQPWPSAALSRMGVGLHPIPHTRAPDVMYAQRMGSTSKHFICSRTDLWQLNSNSLGDRVLVETSAGSSSELRSHSHKALNYGCKATFI
jgi:hypothetical protein